MDLKNKKPTHFISGLPNGGAKGFFVSKRYLSAGQSAVLVTQDEPEDIEAALQTFSPSSPVIAWPEVQAGRMAALYRVQTAQSPVALLLPYEALYYPLPAPAEFASRILVLRCGDSLPRQSFLDALEVRGFTRQDYAESPGQYAARGSVVDVFCPQEAWPARVYFAGNRVDVIRFFDLDTQNTRTQTDHLALLPLQVEQTPATLADYMPGSAFVLDNPPSDTDPSAFSDAAVITPLPSPQTEHWDLKAPPVFNAHMDLLDKEAAHLQQSGMQLTLCCLNRGELDRLSEMMQDYPHLKKATMQIAPLTQGFYDLKEKKAFITSNEMLSRRYHGASLLKIFDVEGAKRVRFKELQPGDYIVHQNHGIGKYLGLETLDKEGTPTDCLLIEYRRGSKLYVPMYDFKKVQKYIGAGGKIPSLSALGGAAWRDVKNRVKEDAQKTAKEILKLEALRQATPAPHVPGDPHVEQEFADSFPYVLTPGQEQAIQEVLHDLTLPKPMDRVLVGDVGFGKTEVALRAALRVALSGKQVMVLVPTTILAAQHYKTFTKRLAGFPVQVQMLCRFQTAKEQKEVISQLKNGVCDIIVGTHRLMSKDIFFKDLGLIVIDEEHRFGVKQKEKIRARSAGVHSLMLSATPIPRTLNQSLSSLRDISLIDTPPRGRTPIKTVVTPWNNDLACAAILQELSRGGQVYYVYNSVQSMESRFLFLKKLVPQAKICMAHGQMNEEVLEQTLWDFNAGKYDVLLASTIIESGIDITNANTLIVENAHHFGLSQLYQLRGRIGRGSSKAYCYLFHPDWAVKTSSAPAEDTFAELAAAAYKTFHEPDPTEEAKKRLAALMEFGDLGSGFKLALRDMEIRGAGELLGVKQHGYVNEVGLSLYCDLVASEVKKLKGLTVQKALTATVNLPLAAYIAPDYLPDDAERLKYYKELMSADEEKTNILLARLADLAGPVPQEVLNLTHIFRLSARASKLQIYHVDYDQDRLELLFARNFVMPPTLPAELFNRYGAQNICFIKSKNGDGVHIRFKESSSPLGGTRAVLTFFEGLISATK